MKKVFPANALVCLDKNEYAETCELVCVLDEEYQLLKEKLKKNEGEGIESEDEELNAIYWRCFSIMEMVFLISRLSKRPVKNFQSTIDLRRYEEYA